MFQTSKMKLACKLVEKKLTIILQAVNFPQKQAAKFRQLAESKVNYARAPTLGMVDEF